MAKPTFTAIAFDIARGNIKDILASVIIIFCAAAYNPEIRPKSIAIELKDKNSITIAIEIGNPILIICL